MYRFRVISRLPSVPTRRREWGSRAKLFSRGLTHFSILSREFCCYVFAKFAFVTLHDEVLTVSSYCSGQHLSYALPR